MTIRFTSTLKGIMMEVPFDVKKEFGRARPPLRVSINGHTYRSTVCVYGGRYFIPVRKSNQQAARVAPGDAVTANIVLDTENRTVEAPPELKALFAQTVTARASWAKLSYSAKKEHADAILQAKRPETRAARVKKIAAQLSAG